MVKHHYNHWLPKLLKANAVTIGKHIFYARSPQLVSDRLRRHEFAHVKQYKKYTIPGFLIIYFYEYLKGRISGLTHLKAYKNIPFEKDAREYERIIE